MQPEARLVKQLREYLEGQEAFVFKVHGGPTMMAGLPDLIACLQGRWLGVEAKMPGNKPTVRQEFVHNQIRKAGGFVCVVHSVEELRNILWDQNYREK